MGIYRSMGETLPTFACRSRPIFQLEANFQLEADNVGSLGALGTIRDFKFNGLAIGEVSVALSLDGGEMHENVGARLALDESKAFAGVKPLYSSLFFQLCFLLFMGYLVPLALQPKTKKAARCELAAPLTNLKVLQE